MGSKDSTGPGRNEGSSGGSTGGSSGAGTGPGRNEGTGRDGNQGGRGTGSGRGNSFMAFVAMMLVAFSLVLGGQPALASPVKEAATINGCDPGNVCIYDWINNNYASGFWQRPYNFSAWALAGSRCVNLVDHQWHDLNGSPNNTASSLIINWGPSTPVRKVTFYDAGGCGAYGGYYYGYNAAPGGTIIETNMAETDRPSCLRGQCDLNWANRVTSIRVEVLD